MPVRLHHAAAEVGARVVLLGDEPIAPGERGLVQLVLDRPIAAAAGDRFVLRDTTAQRTIGGGRFLDLRAPARKRRTPERLAQLAAHAIADPARRAGGAARPPALLPRSRGLRARPRRSGRAQTRSDRRAARRSSGSTRAARRSRMSRPTGWQRLGARAPRDARRLPRATTRTSPGIGLERLRLQLEPRLPAPAFAALLHGLARAGEVALDGAWVRLPGHEVRLDAAGRGALGARSRRCSAAPSASARRGCATSPASSTSPRPRCAGCCKLLGRMGRVDEVAHDHFFLRDTVAEMVGDRRRARRRAGRPVQRRAVPRPARQRPQGGDPDPRVLRPPRRHAAPRRPAPHQPAPARPVSARRRPRRQRRLEENRPRWGVRTSNPGGAVSRSLVGSTPTLFRHLPEESAA